MLSKGNIFIWGMVLGLSLFLLSSINLNAADTTSQVMTHIDEILKANPLEPGKPAQMIPIAQDDTISLFIVRAVPGFVLKSHFHKTHDETLYVIKGAGQMLINDKWVDLKPGSFHFNPLSKPIRCRKTLIWNPLIPEMWPLH